MAAIGFGLAEDAFTKKMQQAPHLLGTLDYVRLDRVVLLVCAWFVDVVVRIYILFYFLCTCLTKYVYELNLLILWLKQLPQAQTSAGYVSFRSYLFTRFKFPIRRMLMLHVSQSSSGDSAGRSALRPQLSHDSRKIEISRSISLVSVRLLL